MCHLEFIDADLWWSSLMHTETIACVTTVDAVWATLHTLVQKRARWRLRPAQCDPSNLALKQIYMLLHCTLTAVRAFGYHAKHLCVSLRHAFGAGLVVMRHALQLFCWAATPFA